MSDINDTLAERGSRYGKFVDHAEVTQNIKRAMMNSNNWDDLDDDRGWIIIAIIQLTRGIVITVLS